MHFHVEDNIYFAGEECSPYEEFNCNDHPPVDGGVGTRSRVVVSRGCMWGGAFRKGQSDQRKHTVVVEKPSSCRELNKTFTFELFLS